jgi:type VI secretion system protein ImpK
MSIDDRRALDAWDAEPDAAGPVTDDARDDDASGKSGAGRDDGRDDEDRDDGRGYDNGARYDDSDRYDDGESYGDGDRYDGGSDGAGQAGAGAGASGAAGTADGPAWAAVPEALPGRPGAFRTNGLGMEPRNPLLAAAMPFLIFAAYVRDLAVPVDPAGLGPRFVAELQRFEEIGAETGIAPEEVRIGRFALCAMADDVVTGCSWGPASGWEARGLVAAFFPTESAPGERFFDLLQQMLEAPRYHLHELELFHACLSLGFEGRFRGQPRGAREIDRLRDTIYRSARTRDSEAGKTLSPAWRGLAERFRPPGLAAPAWVVAAMVAVMLTVLYMQLAGSLGRRSDIVYDKLAGLLPERAVEVARFAPPPVMTAPALTTRLARALDGDLKNGLLEVLQRQDGAVIIRLKGSEMFPPGGDGLRARHVGVVQRVADALAPVPGPVVVIGHTEAGPTHGVRFATNRALSAARADAVAALLSSRLGPVRVTSEGRGESEPVTVNDTRPGRLANRRVDIVLHAR